MIAPGHDPFTSMSDRYPQIHSQNFRPGRAAFSLGLMTFILSSFLMHAPVYAEPLTVEDWLDLGWDYYNHQDIDEAFNAFLQAVEHFPENAEAHVALGEMYLAKDVTDRGRDQMLIALQLDDETHVAARAHYLYAYSFREENPAQALLHLDRAFRLEGSQALQFDIAHQTRFCRLLIAMSGRTEAAPVVIHFRQDLFTQDEVDATAIEAESALFTIENFCFFEVEKPIHFFLYPSKTALLYEIPEGYEFMLEYREYHIVWQPEFDWLTLLSIQVIEDLQESLNRHAGASWILETLPTAATGRAPWPTSAGPAGEQSTDIDTDDAVRALLNNENLVDLQYLWSEEFGPYIPEPVALAELGSFLRWVRKTYSVLNLQEILTQPNVELVLHADVTELQEAWLRDLELSESLISDPVHAESWAASLPDSPLAGNAELPVEVLKEGLRIYLDGEWASGIREIHRALEMDPGFGLAYYALGWIASQDGNWIDAKDRLTTAVLLMEDPNELAWCHMLLAPMYLNEARWDVAQASLQYVSDWSESPQSRNRADELIARVRRIQSFRMNLLNRSTIEFSSMRDFMSRWNVAVNNGEDLSPMIDDTMDETESEELMKFYSGITDNHPSIVLNHALQKVGRDGMSLLLEVRIQAVFPDSSPYLTGELEPLGGPGYLMFFKVGSSEDGWVVVDWESGWFPLTPIKRYTSEDLGLGDDSMIRIYTEAGMWEVRPE